MKKALVGNAADPQQVKDAALKERLNLRDEAKDLRDILEMPQGRRFIWKLLEKTRVFSAGFLEPNLLTFREGERNVGVFLLGEIQKANPDSLIQMMKEANDE
jgi:hypothetical protein